MLAVQGRDITIEPTGEVAEATKHLAEIKDRRRFERNERKNASRPRHPGDWDDHAADMGWRN